MTWRKWCWDCCDGRNNIHDIMSNLYYLLRLCFYVLKLHSYKLIWMKSSFVKYTFIFTLRQNFGINITSAKKVFIFITKWFFSDKTQISINKLRKKQSIERNYACTSKFTTNLCVKNSLFCMHYFTHPVGNRGPVLNRRKPTDSVLYAYWWSVSVCETGQILI